MLRDREGLIKVKEEEPHGTSEVQPRRLVLVLVLVLICLSVWFGYFAWIFFLKGGVG